MTDTLGLKSSLLSAYNDALEVVQYGSGLLIYLPLHHSDDDTVTIHVEQYQGGYLVSDQGSTSLRLQLADVNLSSPRIGDAWTSALGAVRNLSFGAGTHEIAAWGPVEQLPALISRVGEACLRADQVRILAGSSKKVSFADRVVNRVETALSPHSGMRIRKRATVSLRSGRTRQATALVENQNQDPVLILQAVGGVKREDKEDQLERCFHLFSFAEVPKESRIAVAIGHPDSWDTAMVSELRQVSSEVVFFDDNREVELALAGHLSNEDVALG